MLLATTRMGNNQTKRQNMLYLNLTLAISEERCHYKVTLVQLSYKTGHAA